MKCGKLRFCKLNCCNPRQAQKEEASKATGSAGDTAETLPQTEDQQLETLIGVVEAEAELDDQEVSDVLFDGSDGEGAEEEDPENDEVVECVVDHESSNNYDDVRDEDGNDDADTPEEHKEAAKAKATPDSCKGSKKQATRSQAKKLEVPQPDEAEAAEVLESDGEGDGQTSKQTHKDPTILSMSLLVFVPRMGYRKLKHACVRCSRVLALDLTRHFQLA